jgi:hypothetical protein
MAKSKGRLLSELAEAPKNEDYSDVNALPNTGNKVGDQAFVEETDRLYIWNGSGWYNIALINTTPTWDSGGQPAGSYVLDADSPQTSTTITLAASDPEGLPISYNYITGGSMDSIATISQDSSVFTITPKTSTQVPDGGTGSITFRATDGVNILPQVSSFTLSFITVIENSKYTTLLVTATGTSDNNNITDASSNNHSITVTGDTYAGTFSPYRSGGYSMYFDGSGGDYVRSPTHADFGFSTDDFTIECWYYPVSKAQNYPRIWHFGPYWSNANSLCFQDRHNSWSTTFSLVAFSGGEILNSTTTVENGNWYHLTVERSGTTITLYVNGVAEDTYNIGTSQFITSSTSYVTLGNVSDGSNLNESQLNGYIRDFRYVKGTAVYDGNFTPTTEPLEEITNTKLFTSHLPYITDGSNNHSLTLSGDVYTKPFSPYDYDEYSATNHGGSINFDGSGDHLTIPDHSSLNFASNDWTIECWIYPRTNVGDCGIWHQSASGTDWYSIYLDGAFNLKFVFYNLSNGVEWAGTAASNTAPQNTWTHVALVRQFGTGVYLYANGKLVASDTLDASVTMLDKTYNHVIGYERFVGSGTYFDGFISDFKMDIGTAHYTAEFTPPTAPLSSSSADMHIKGTDASIIDKAQGSNLKLVGNTTGSTSQVKFGGSKSMYFDGTTDYIVSQEPVKLGTQDFTAECWLYYQSGLELMGNRVTNGSGGFSVRITSTSLTVGNSSGSGFGSVFSGTTSSLTNAWHHIAVSRSSGVTKIYVDGTSIASHSSSIDFSLSNPFVIGYAYTNGSGADSIQGWIQDFRITNGLARYTANFTPPTASLEG